LAWFSLPGRLGAHGPRLRLTFEKGIYSAVSLYVELAWGSKVITKIAAICSEARWNVGRQMNFSYVYDMNSWNRASLKILDQRICQAVNNPS
jgi:hypothetical protein